MQDHAMERKPTENDRWRRQRINPKDWVKAKCEWCRKNRPWLEPCCSIALVVITFFYVGFAGIQSCSAIKSANAAKTAAKAATEALDDERTNVIIDQRAWVSVVHVFAPGDANGDRKKIVPVMKIAAVNIRNTGKSIALKVRMTALATMEKGGNLPNICTQIRDPIKNEDGFPFSINHDVGKRPKWADTGKEVSLSQSVMNEIKSGQTLFVYGRVDYEDVFGYIHWETYCYQLNNKKEGQFDVCPKYNDTDNGLMLGKDNKLTLGNVGVDPPQPCSNKGQTNQAK